MRGALEDLETSGLDDKDRALLRFVAQLNGAPASVREEDIATLHAVGWDDAAIYDAIGVCALFNFYNRWIDGAGVHGTPELYAASGERMARTGYSREDP